MKRLLAIILIAQFPFGVAAQKTSFLNGSWQSFGDAVYRDDKDSILSWNINSPVFIVTFDDGKVNLSNYPQRSLPDSTIYKECKASVRKKRKRIYLRDIRYVDSLAILNSNERYSCYHEKRSITYDYQILSDSEIVLTEVDIKVDTEFPFEGVFSAEYKLKKIPTIKYTPLSVLKNRNQDKVRIVLGNKLYLTKYDSLHKTVRLKVGGEFEIYTEKSSKEPHSVDEGHYYVDAIDSTATDSTIKVHTIKETISMRGPDCYATKKTKYNRAYFYKAPLTEIKLSEISYISYNGPNSLKAHTVSKNIGLISLLSALVVAPLVSLDYTKPDFNKHRYFNVAGISLATMTLSFTIAGITNYTQYLIGKTYRKNSGWRIINKPG